MSPRCAPVVVAALAVALAAVLGAAGQAAAAAPELVSPAPSAVAPPGRALTFEVRLAEPAERVAIVAGERAPDGSVRPLAAGLAEPVAGDPLRLRLVLPPSSLLLRRQGRYVWGADTDAGTTALRRLDVIAPASWRRRSRIPRRLGRRGSGTFLLASGGIPRGVPRGRFALLARVSAWRWGLRAGGWTRTRPGVADGRSVVGFGPAVPRRALALQRDVYINRYERRMRCNATRCVPGPRRLVGSALYDRDVTIRPDIPWTAGPWPPTFDEVDLETTLIHELGHFAGTKRHLSRCANSPMAVGLANGEWWRTPRDRWIACGARATAARLLAPPRLGGPVRRIERRVVVHRVVTRSVVVRR